MMKYTNQIKKSSKYVAFAFVITSATVFIISGILPYSAFFQIIAFGIAAFGIHTTQRYVLSEFIYVLSDTDSGEVILSVTKVVGNKSTVVCRLALSNCKYFGLADNFNDKLAIKYSYVQNFFPTSDYLFVYCDGNKNIGVHFELDEELADAITARLNPNVRNNVDLN